MENDEFSMLYYAVQRVTEMSEDISAQYHEKWEKVRNAAIEQTRS
jgi:hypothetical protein